MPQKKRNAAKAKGNAVERLFSATFGRNMTAEERKSFIFEKAATLKEISEREERLQAYRFLRQT